MKETLQIILSAIDNASSVLKNVQDTAENLEENLQEVGAEGKTFGEKIKEGADESEKELTQLNETLETLLAKKKQMQEEGTWGFNSESSQLDKEIAKVKKQIGEIDDEPIKPEFDDSNIQLGLQNFADGILRAKEGVVELGRNVMETLSLAGQQQQQTAYLSMSYEKMGKNSGDVAKTMKTINDLVAELPGDDVAIGGLLSQAAAKNASITADELQRMGDNAADYFAAMNNYGKSSIEAQQDLTNYILAGNTAELERSPVLQAHIDKLKEATTVEERNKALQEALNEEGWAGITNQETYNTKLETFTSMLDRGKREMGEMFLGAASGAMDFIGDIDSASGGVVRMGIAMAAVSGGPLIDLVTGVGQMATGLKAIKDAGVVTALAEMIPFLEASETGFLGMALAEGVALGPILAIIAAIALLGVAVYEVGNYFGWWSDVGSMIDAIWEGIQRLWSAFINHPDVQGFLTAMGYAWNIVSNAVMKAFTWVLSFFNNANATGKFDIVRALIDGIGIAWQAITSPIRNVITIIRFLWTTMRTATTNIQNAINNIHNWFVQLPGRIRGAISTLKSVITKPFHDAYTGVSEVVNNIITRIKNITGVDIGSVTQKLTKPITDAYNQISKTVGNIINKINSIGSNPLGAIGFGFDIEGMIQEQLAKQQLTTTNNNETLQIDHTVNFKFDFSNIPANLSGAELRSLLQDAFTDKVLLQTIINNPDFQNIDLKAKNRLNQKRNRMSGGGI